MKIRRLNNNALGGLFLLTRIIEVIYFLLWMQKVINIMMLQVCTGI